MRDSYDKPSRLNASVLQSVKKQRANENQLVKLFVVDSLEDLNQIEIEQINAIAIGSMATMFDANGYPSKVFVWSGNELKWKELPSMSVDGPILTEGTISERGIVQLAKDGEESSSKVVQSNDKRLNKEWLAQKKEPKDTSSLWIDTSKDPIIKWFDENKWIEISNNKIIDDSIDSIKSTYSSEKIKKLLINVAKSDHKHIDLNNHLKAEGNIHNMKASDLKDFSSQVLSIKEIESTIKIKHTHNNELVIGKLNDVDGELYYNSNPVGRGDMLKSHYDIDNDGIIDKASMITDGNNHFSVIDLLNISKKGHEHTNSKVLDLVTEPFTKELKHKLDKIQNEAIKYVHPDKHSATMIEQTEKLMFSSLEEKTSWSDKYSVREIDDLLLSKVSKSMVGVPGGLAVLDPSGTLSVDQLPMRFKETKVVETIAERDFINKFSGLRVFVEDASDDNNVGSGSAEYVWNGTRWKLLSGLGMMYESLKFYVDENTDKLIIKAKYGNGKIKTAELPLL